MSAFICSDSHIFTIAKIVGDYFGVDSQELADKLKSINIDSVNHRYSEKTRKNKCKPCKLIETITVDDVAKLIDCFDYQACEKVTPDYCAYSSMLKTWISKSGANSKYGRFWSI